MQYRRLGRTGVKVSEVGLGGWLTHGRSLVQESTDSVVTKAFDLGVNFFDTADVYNHGEAEVALGKSVKELRRQDLFIATKCFFPMSDAPNDRGNSRKHTHESIDGSLRRLKMDYVDLYQYHRFDPDTPIEESVRAMDDLIRIGKVLYWGVSLWPAEAITEAVQIARSMNCCPPVSNQPVYNMLQRDIEPSVIPTSQKHGLGQVVFSPLAQGVLTGKYKPGQAAPPGTRASDDSSNTFMGWLMTDETLTKVQKLVPVAQEAGLTLAQLALAWCLRQENVSSVIIGATRPEQVEENAGASGAQVSEDVWARIDQVLQS
ncbi:MAG: aldo/keto reductase family protein [Fimbriimonadaceae bacterium]|nr:aldo/keto reductase family protein [Fimbriimonadaceae bacterium]QYK57267.1 MAG: aldo/keto reductase family protein [Fimbriimonadaceae bacterium]